MSTLYKKDYKTTCGLHGKQQQFIIDNEKRQVRIKFDPKMTKETTFQADYRPFQMKAIVKEEED